MFETTRRHLFLSGFMGTGKTVIGREVARRLGWAFIDLDEFIASLCHRTIPDLFRDEGEESFRDYESRALRLAVISPHSIIALGGGTPIRSANGTIIRATGRCWLLESRMELIWQRVRGEIGRRPILAGVTANRVADDMTFEEFLTLATPIMHERVRAYASIADHTLDTSDEPIENLAGRIIEEFTMDAARGTNR